jgi:hypothetical protein
MLHKTILGLFVSTLLLGAAPATHAAADIGDLVKCDEFSTVYFFAEDGNRYAFPNEKIYFSWYQNFDDVKTISCDALANLQLAGNVVYQPGTSLLKLQSVPTVYAVESGGVLRAIGSEEQAVDLYGDDWADFVDDLPDAFLSSFEIGEELSEEELPEGMVLVDENGSLLRVEDDGSAVEIDDVLEDEEDESLLSEVAESLEEVERKIEIEITVSQLSDLQSEEILALLELLETVDIDAEFEIEIEIEIEEEGEDEYEEAEEELEEAAEEIARAMEKIEEREGKDVTEAEALLAEAERLYEEAEELFAAGEYDAAEELAEEAQEYAEDARMGSAVRSLDDEDEEDEMDDEDEQDDEDESDDDEGDSEDEEDDDDDADEEDEEDEQDEV